MKRVLTYPTFLFLLFLLSCGDEVLVPSTYLQEREYFPLVTGNWIRYQVDSIVHIDNELDACEDSVNRFHFEILETVDYPFVDGEQDTAYRIARFRRTDSLQNWSFCSMWTSKLKQSGAERVEDNLRFVKLSFPFDRRATWNGNAYNNQDPETYKYEEIGFSRSINSIVFPATVKVLQNDFVTSIGATVKWEIYARGIGMVEKYVKDVRLLYGCGASPVIDDGLEYSLKVLDYEIP
ncbi:MAG: hypothetical protein ACKOQ6_06130 [Bacteroidota bacterium]